MFLIPIELNVNCLAGSQNYLVYSLRFTFILLLIKEALVVYDHPNQSRKWGGRANPKIEDIVSRKVMIDSHLFQIYWMCIYLRWYSIGTKRLQTIL